jgi:hypothetical protein
MDCKWNTTLIHAEVKAGVELLMLPANIGPCREREDKGSGYQISLLCFRSFDI